MLHTIHCDLTVVGGGMPGITAALSAARRGLRVALVEWRDVLGGNHSGEHRVHYNGAGNVNISYYAREGGIADELKLTIFHKNPYYNYKQNYDLTDMALFSLVRDEPNITLFLGTSVYGAEKNNDRVVRVFARKTRTEDEYIFVSPLYADASGDGVLANAVGADGMQGRESKSDFGESLAPDERDSHTMGSCILFTVGKADHDISFVRPDFAYDYRKDDFLRWLDRPETWRSLPKPDDLDGMDGIWWLSYGGMEDTIKDADEIDLELKKLLYGLWDYIKNSGAYPNAGPYYLSWIAPVPSKRESRRFYGDYVVRQEDLENQTPFYDRISTGGWSIDVHDPGGVYGSLKTSLFHPIHGLYTLPYRSTYSRNIRNLFLCGRIASVTHIALGSVRVMQTLAAMAQGVGTAAWLCVRDGLLPRDIAEPERVKELQRELQKDGQYIPDLPEDPGLLFGARATADAESEMENRHLDLLLPLSRGHILALPVAGERFIGAELAFVNDSDTEKTVTVRLFTARRQDSYECDTCCASASLCLPPHFNGFYPVRFDARLPHHLALLMIDPCADVSIYATFVRITGAPCFYAKGDRTGGRLIRTVAPKVSRNLAICFRALCPGGDFTAAHQVLNGISRPVALPNGWRAPLGSTLTITLPEPRDLNEIRILFNGQTETDHFSTAVETLAKDYDLTVITGDREMTIPVRGNYLAFVRHPGAFCGVTALKIRILSTYGNPYAEIFSVKAF